MPILDDIRPLQLAINRREKLLMKVVVERAKKQARWNKMGLRLTKKGVPDKRFCPHTRTKVVTLIVGNEDAMHFNRHGKLDPICINGEDARECCECGKII